jgi:putative SOS response-associated peptidase YedK
VKGKGQPFYFQGPDGEPVVFAGLWDLWFDAEGRPMGTCTIITTTANETMAPVHHRMPLLLPPKHWDRWLHPGPFDPRLNEMLVPAADVLLEAHPVGTFVNYTTNDGPELVVPEPLEDVEVQKTLFELDEATKPSTSWL